MSFQFVFLLKYKKDFVRNDNDTNESSASNATNVVEDISYAMPTITLMPKTERNLISDFRNYGISEGGVLGSYSQEKLDKYFQELREIGATWVRYDIDWNFIQHENGDQFDWVETDRIVNTANKYGINSLATIAYAPKWAASVPCSYPACIPKDPEVFGKFAKSVASRYKDKINTYEIWNEPNYDPFWKNPDPVKYYEILKSAYTNIKSVNSNAVIVSGGLASVENGQNGNSYSPITYIRKLYELQANKYFDSIGLHPYTYPLSPKYRLTRTHWQDIADTRSLMNSKGENNKNIWITEFGSATGGPGKPAKINGFAKFNYGSDFMSDEAQAVILKDAVELINKSNFGIYAFFVYSLVDQGDSSETTENFFGLKRINTSKKPAYYIFQEAAKANN